jgi:hypothetical protein
MLKLGVNSVGTDYNRKTIYVHHITDDITGKSVPICGADIYDFTDGGEAEPYLAILNQGRNPFDGDTSSRMCGSCIRAYSSKGSDEEKANRRLARSRRKEARAGKIKANKQTIISEWLHRCPRCQQPLIMAEPLGYTDAEGECKHCPLKWSFSILAEPSGNFVIFADDEDERVGGRGQGNIELKTIDWTWR